MYLLLCGLYVVMSSLLERGEHGSNLATCCVLSSFSPIGSQNQIFNLGEE